MWGVSIRSVKAQKMLIYEKFKKAKQVALAAKEKYASRPDVIIELISRSKAYPPPAKLKRQGRLWCPYCCKLRAFYWDTQFDLNRCPICGISDHDYYVRTYNNLWQSQLSDKKVRR